MVAFGVSIRSCGDRCDEGAGPRRLPLAQNKEASPARVTTSPDDQTASLWLLEGWKGVGQFRDRGIAVWTRCCNGVIVG